MEDYRPEMVITHALYSRMKAEDCLRPGDRESVAYRVAEVMVLAKHLYTEVLPRLMGQAPEPSGESLFEELAGLRMALLNLRDLVGDFDEAFLEAMHHQRETDAEEAEDPEEADESPPTNGSRG
ncbi:MAG: hypothetical protein AB1758_20315 [Candidatus Eremiobacterota bacterium]